MARKPRIQAQGAIVHVIQRGVERRKIFLDRQDYERFLWLLGETAKGGEIEVVAYALMSNHVHLVIRCGNVPIGQPLRTLFFRYAGWFNRRHGRSGHLFQGRYKAVLVATDAYVQQLIRYVHRNPVRAGLSRRAVDYEYSSHRGYVRKKSPEWLAESVGLRQFDRSRDAARRKLAAFVDAEAKDSPRLDFQRGNNKDYDALGPDGWEIEVEKRGKERCRDRRSEPLIVAAVAAEYGVEEKDLALPGRERQRSEARSVAALLTRAHGEGTIASLARRFKRDQAVLSRTARNAADRLGRDRSLRARIDRIEKRLGVVGNI
jgi:REP element-mobilizing transposase RayT